jgi:hypothetical protein
MSNLLLYGSFSAILGLLKLYFFRKDDYGAPSILLKRSEKIIVMKSLSIWIA